MSRRDTIILAVLINATLLTVLFVTATRPAYREPPPVAAKVVEAPPQILPSLNPSSGFVATRYEPQERFEPIARVVEPEPIHENEPEPSSTPEEQYVEVMVKRGDFLEKIARVNGTTIAEIKRINNLNSDRIDIGQVLLVPAVKKAATVVPVALPVKQEVAQENGEFYTIKPGDNPWNIARQQHVKMDELLRLNGLDEEKARNLKPGDRIRIR